jgi:hypothetical protein
MSDDQKDGEESLADVLASIRARVGQHERELRGQAPQTQPDPDPEDEPLILGGGESTLDPSEDDGALLLTDPVPDANVPADPEPEEPLHLSDYLDTPDDVDEAPLILTEPEDDEEPLVLSDRVADEAEEPLVLSEEDSTDDPLILDTPEDAPLVLDTPADADSPLLLTEEEDSASDPEEEAPLILSEPEEEPLILDVPDHDAPDAEAADSAVDEPLILSDASDDGAGPEPMEDTPALRLVTENTEEAAPAELPAMAQQDLPPPPAPMPADDPAPAAPEIDEETLRAMIRDVIREELQGDLGQTLSNNIGAMIRDELANAFKRG